jgi:hypothetical protein
MDENWLHHYDPETKLQAMDWRHRGSPRPSSKKIRVQNSLEISRLDFVALRRYRPQ